MNPQRFDQPVYEQTKRKIETESKRMVVKQEKPERTESRPGKKPAAKARPRAVAKSKSM